jgi:hypothetical protein
VPSTTRPRITARGRRALILSGAVGVLAFGPVATSGATLIPAPNACSLLASHDVQAAFGGTVGDGSLTTAPDGTQSVCDWVVLVNPSRGYGVQLDVYSGRSRSDFALQRKVARGRTRTIKRLGDGAFSERTVLAGHVFDDLWVRHGTINFRVEVLKDLGSKPLVPLARLVLTKL